MQSYGAVGAVNLLSEGDASSGFPVHVHGFCEWRRLSWTLCCGVSCEVDVFLMGAVCQKMDLTKRTLIYSTAL